jgi:hypothetical protein
MHPEFVRLRRALHTTAGISLDAEGQISQDTEQGVFFARQLEAIDARVYSEIYARSRFREFLPLKTSAGWSTFEVYKVINEIGVARFISDYATDTGSVSVEGREVKSRIYDIAQSADWSIRDLNAAGQAGISLDTTHVDLARRQVERLLNETALLGNTERGLEGLLNHSSITPSSVAAGGGGSNWVDKTPDEIVEDVSEMVRTVHDDSNEEFSINTVILPTVQMDLIRTLRMTGNTDRTVLSYLRENFPEITFTTEPRLKGLGAGSTDRMVGYERNPMILECSLPLDATRLPPEIKPLHTRVTVMAATGGVLLRHPLAVVFRDNI